MKLKTKAILVGAAGIVVVAGAVATARAIKRATRRAIDRKMRRVLSDVVSMKAEDFVPGGTLGKSLFMRRIEKLSNKQLAFLCAMVQAGYFIKVSKIDPAHPTEDQIRRAVDKLRIEERLAPNARENLLQALDTTDAHDALALAFAVLALA